MNQYQQQQMCSEHNLNQPHNPMTNSQQPQVGYSGDASKWKQEHDPSTGRHYWYHEETKQTQWDTHNMSILTSRKNNNPNKDSAYIHCKKHQIKPDNLLNGIEACVAQIGNGVMKPVRGVFNGVEEIATVIADGDALRPVSGIKNIVSQSITGVEKVATAPKLITNGLFNTILPSENKEENNEKIDVIPVHWALRNEKDFIDNKLLGIKSGDGWSKNEQNEKVLLRHDAAAQAVAVEMHCQIEPTHMVSGIVGGTKKIVCSVSRPLKGVFDIFRKPYECYQEKKSWTSIPKGFVMGLRNTVESPFLVVKDALDGTRNIVEGVLNTPEAARNYKRGLRFNSWMGWVKGHQIQGLKTFPGEPGDMLCIQQTLYSHVMIKLDDDHVIHRSGGSNVVKNGPSQVEIREAHAGVVKSTLAEIQEEYDNQCITVVNADYCIVTKDDKYLVYKKRGADEIIQRAISFITTNSNGWELFGKNCEHFCFNILFGVDISIQVQMIFSLNQ